MAPGVYVIDGGALSINSTATVNGSGVTFYLTNGATVSMNGGASVHLERADVRRLFRRIGLR